MKIELTHDFIAKKIYEDASIEDKNRAKASKCFHERYQHYVESPMSLLTQDDLNYLEPYLEEMELSSEEVYYLDKSRDTIKRKYRKKKIKSYGMVVLFCTFFFGMWGMWERSRSTTAQSELAYLQDSIKMNQRNIQIKKDVDYPSTTFSFHPIHLKGIVKNEKQEPVADAWISVLGVSIHTKKDGTFDTHLILSPQDMKRDIKLEFSQIGYQIQKHSLDVDLQEAYFDVVLKK